MTGELAEAAFLLRTGWSWNEYESAPDAVVADMMEILNAEAEWAKAQREGE